MGKGETWGYKVGSVWDGSGEKEECLYRTNLHLLMWDVGCRHWFSACVSYFSGVIWCDLVRSNWFWSHCYGLWSIWFIFSPLNHKIIDVFLYIVHHLSSSLFFLHFSFSLRTLLSLVVCSLHPLFIPHLSNSLPSHCTWPFLSLLHSPQFSPLPRYPWPRSIWMHVRELV